MTHVSAEILADVERLRAIVAGFEAGAGTSVAELAPGSGLRPDLDRLYERLAEIESNVRMQAEGEAFGSGELFEEMAGYLPEAVFRTDADLRLVYANQTALDMVGASQSDLEAGLCLLDYVDEADRAQVTRTIGELGLGRLPAPAVFKAKRQDGRVLFVEAVAATIWGDTGEITGLWGAGRDVTQRVESDNLARILNGLRHSLAATSDLQMALEQVLDAALLLDGLDSGCIYVADPNSEVFVLAVPRGLSPEFVEAAGSGESDAFHMGPIDQWVEGGLVRFDYEDLQTWNDYPLMANEGLRSTATLTISDGGRPAMFLGVSSHVVDAIPEATIAALQELSQQLEGPIARIRAEQARREVVETLEALLSAAPLAIYSLDLDGKVTMWNSAAEKMFGWSESEVLGRLLPHVPASTLQEFYESLDSAAAGGSLEPLEFSSVPRKDGSTISTRLSRSLLHDHRGRLVGHVCVSEDVTEKKHIEEDRLRLARLESLGVMAGGIAHDFNNLLMGVLGNVSLARGETDPEKLEELLSGVQRASEKAVSLTNQLLTFAKGGAPAKELAVLNDLVADVVGFTLSGSPVRVDYLLSETWPVEVDLGQIGQVIQNLIINAKEAIPAEQGTIVVSTKDRTEGNGDEYVEIAVSNTGPPIPARIRERIFDPYFSTKKAGSGLGLAVAHSVVTRHGGRIEVESAKASGTTFRVLLPARPGVTEDKDALALPIEHKETSLQVLVIDDEEMVRKILSRMLSILGHESVLASSGDEAVKIAQAAHEAGQHFELAIMDLTMPGSLGGVQATAALHKIDPALQVIVSSGYSDDPAIAEYGKYGFAAAIQKPYTLDSLKATLERVV